MRSAFNRFFRASGTLGANQARVLAMGTLTAGSAAYFYTQNKRVEMPLMQL